MQLRTTIEYADPSPIAVRITLVGPLEGFEKLRDALRKVPLYEVDNLSYQIDEAVRQLRARTTVSDPAPRRMLAGDLGLEAGQP